MAKLTLIRGLPGAGKTFYAKKHYDCLHLEADMYHIEYGVYAWDSQFMKNAHDWCYTTTEKALFIGMDVVVCNTFTRLWEMKRYLKLAEDYNVLVEVIKIVGSFQNVHSVPAEALKRMADRWEDYPGERTVVNGARIKQ